MRLEELERAEKKIKLEELIKEQALKEKELQLKFDLERFKIESGFRCSDYRVFERFGILVRHSSVYHPQTLRTVSHESTGYTPSELVYGKILQTPETLVMEHWMESEEEGDLVTEYMFKLINRLKRCQEVAINKMEEMQAKRKTWYDKNAVKREFKDGDLVLVLATSRANKLAVQWIGPGDNFK
ncbi:retrovirus-related Pol polyprotein from transposon 17.6 [Trichonephila clavipes]|nr:retrovirus-related Pol polyprotein from transposon 17.6 [Trichonephila clavipes]